MIKALDWFHNKVDPPCGSGSPFKVVKQVSIKSIVIKNSVLELDFDYSDPLNMNEKKSVRYYYVYMEKKKKIVSSYFTNFI